MTPPTGRPLRRHLFPADPPVVVGGITVVGLVGGWSWARGFPAEVSPWSGPLVVAAAVLALAGLAKVVRPAPAADALAAIRLPVPLPVVRGLGGGEVAVGTVAVVAGGRLAAAVVAIAYLGFAVVSRALARSGAPGCGCFGRRVDAAPGALHVTLNVLAAVAAAGAALTSSGGLHALVVSTPWAGIPAVLASAVGVGLLLAAYVTVPEVLAATRPSSGPRTFALVEDAAR